MNALIGVGFILGIGGLLALDLGALEHGGHPIGALARSTKEAFGWTALWAALALLFNAVVYLAYERHWLGIGLSGAFGSRPLTGHQATMQFFTAFVVDKALTLDQVFVMAMIFAYFRIPAQHQHRLLVWGAVGAVSARSLAIGAGIAWIRPPTWILYVLGGVLIATALKMLFARHDSLEPDRVFLVRAIKRFCPFSDGYSDGQLVVRGDGGRALTPLGLALAIIGSTNLQFGVDAIPATFAVTHDPFIMATANLFSLLGLRSLYVALAAVMDRFRYLKISLAVTLTCVGIKMVATRYRPVDTWLFLAVVLAILLAGALASILVGHKDAFKLQSPLRDELAELSRVTVRTVRRVFVLLAGSTLLLVGAALVVLPGPGSLVIIAGLALLATEFVWARAWMKWAKDTVKELAEDARDLIRRDHPNGKE